MNSELINFGILAFMFLVLFAIAEFGYHFLKVKPEWTRKFVHLGTGLLALLFPVMLKNHWHVLLLCASFFILLNLSLKFNFLKSINDIPRKSIGSLAFPISVYGCYLAFCFFERHYFYFYLPILILAISDPIAALVGKHVPGNKINFGKKDKTLMGSLAFFLSAAIISFVLIIAFKKYEGTLNFVLYTVLIAFVATIAEAFSSKGWDNITIPASVLATLFVLEYL
jgi:phytol kinase